MEGNIYNREGNHWRTCFLINSKANTTRHHHRPRVRGQRKLKSVMTPGCGFKADPLADEQLLAAEVGVEVEELVLG